MKKFVTIVLAVLLLAVGFWADSAEAAKYWFQVKDEQGRAITSGFRCQIYTVASRSNDALFTDTGYGTKKTNPMDPDSNGVCEFATSASTVDVLVYGHSGNARGAVARVVGLTDTMHGVILDTQKIEKQIRFYFDADISRGAETDTGIDLPIGALVTDVWVEVATGFALSSVSVGLLSTEASGNTSGFCISQGIDQTWGIAPGYTDPSLFRCQASRTHLAAIEGFSGDEPYALTSNTRGVLIASFTRGQRDQGAVAGTVYTSLGQYQEYPHLVRPGAAASIVYQTNDRQTTSRGAAGWITIFYKALRNK